MFAPTKTWRRWHRKINTTEKRHALVSAISASGVPALVMARGHRIDQVAEIPLVLDTKAVSSIDKTSKAQALLKSINAFADVEKVIDSKGLRAGKGKLRNRRYVQRRGPLVVFSEKGPMVKALRNIPGVELINVNYLNLLLLAPGGHLGRFVIWTKDAFEKLDKIYGTYKKTSSKVGYKLPRPIMTNADLGRIINSDEIQRAIRPKRFTRVLPEKRNPLKNAKALARLNPHGLSVKRSATVAHERQTKKRAEQLEKKRKGENVAPTDADKKKKASDKAAYKKVRTSTKAYRTALKA